jgi:(R,R)-butanediol dehydrogenase / meso-butanediol dehydrogenase / diacetyl reductase
MKALRLYGKEDIRYVEAPEPSPGPGQIKAKIRLAGICGSDLKTYTHGPLMAAKSLPMTLGHEFAGTVAELGKGVKGFKVGDRVSGVGYWKCGECDMCKRGLYNICMNMDFTGGTVDGAMAEYLVAPAYSFYKLPDSVSDEAGAMVEPLAVALHAVRRANVQLGDTVGVVGDGTIGICTVMSARAAGASEVYVIAKHRSRGKLASTAGATEVIYPGEGDPVQKIMKLTSGIGVDAAFECVGRPETPQLSVDITRRAGTTVLMGVIENPAPFNFRSLTFTDRNLLGSAIYIHEGKTAIDLMADKRIDPTCLITSKVPLKDAIEKGFKKLLNNKEDNIKILLQVP